MVTLQIFFQLSFNFASISLHKSFHDPRTILSGRKVCVGNGGGLKVSLVLALVQNQGLGFGFGLEQS